MLIVFEGIDKSGKTTQLNALRDALVKAGRDVATYKMPDRESATGKVLTKYLAGGVNLSEQRVAELFSANRAEVMASIKGDLADGKIVLCDRYVYSGAAYSKLSIDEWYAVESKQPDHCVPDLILYLLATPRDQYDDPEVYENPDDLSAANDKFVRIFTGQYPQYFGKLNVCVIATGTIAEVGKRVCAAVNAALAG